MTINNYADMQKLVGAVVLRFANIEAMIDALIQMHYVPDPTKGHEFLLDVLADEGFSFALRCNTLRKLLARNTGNDKDAQANLQLLRKVGNTRNLLAHIGKMGIVGQKAGYLHPKKPGEVINSADAELKFKEFEADCTQAEAFLLAWLLKISPYQRALRRETEASGQTKVGPDGVGDK
jgi:hypothetical protein